MHRDLRASYGDIVRVPTLPGRKNIIVTFDPVIYEKVFRTEGKYPVRDGIDAFVYYRKKVRPDIFGESGGLLTEDGEKWHDVRSKVNPVMLQPKTVNMYVEKTDQVAREFVDLIRRIRDPRTLEAPDTFGQNFKCWALEVSGVIALDERLGALKNDTAESRKMIDVRVFPRLTLIGKSIFSSFSSTQLFIEFLELTLQLEMNPMWKLYATKPFKRLMKVFDEMTDIVMPRIDKAISRMEAGTNSDKSDRSLLEKLLEINRSIAISMAFDTFMGGIDTVSSDISFDLLSSL